MDQVRSDDRGIHLAGALTLDSIPLLEREIRQLILRHPRSGLQGDLSQSTDLDTAGAVFLRRLPRLARQADKELTTTPLPAAFQEFFDFVSLPEGGEETDRLRTTHLEGLGERIGNLNQQIVRFLYLMTDLTWSAVAALLRPRGIRRGTFIDQAIAIGSQGLPIVALILFLIGAVSSLQAAAQLRQFGANIYVADLLAIGITRELGPLMTAIIVSGRSGSAIAAEIATMKFTEELDALQTMALDPLRFVAVPKMWAMILCVPMLTLMADCVGILGGVLIGITSIGVAPAAFIDQVLGSLFLRDVVTGLIKSVSFAWIITIIAVYRGLSFSGGAAGVGHATTASVVGSIFGVIVLDSFWGLIFYMK